VSVSSLGLNRFDDHGCDFLSNLLVLVDDIPDSLEASSFLSLVLSYMISQWVFKARVWCCRPLECRNVDLVDWL
jgi:hypothetical protein